MTASFSRLPLTYGNLTNLPVFTNTSGLIDGDDVIAALMSHRRPLCSASRSSFQASNTAHIQQVRNPPSNVKAKSVNISQNRRKKAVTAKDCLD